MVPESRGGSGRAKVLRVLLLTLTLPGSLLAQPDESGSGEDPPLLARVEEGVTAGREKAAVLGAIREEETPPSAADWLAAWLAFVPRGGPEAEASEQIETILVGGLEERGLDEMRTAFGAFLESAPDVPSRQRALRLLGRMVGRETAPLLARLLSSFEAMDWATPGLATQAGEAVLRLALVDTDNASGLLAIWDEVPAPARKSLLERCRRRGDRAARNLLLTLLSTRGAAFVPVARTVAALPPRRAWLLGEKGRERLDHALRTGDPEMRAAALRALAAMEPRSEVHRFVEYLSDREVGVVQAALGGLMTTTDLRLGLDPEKWREWLETEEAWFESRVVALENALLGHDTPEKIEALREIAVRRLHSPHFLPLVGDIVVGARDQGVRHAALSVLRAWNDPRATPFLLTALEDPDEETRELAHEVLVLLLHVDLGADPETWRAELSLARHLGATRRQVSGR